MGFLDTKEDRDFREQLLSMCKSILKGEETLSSENAALRRSVDMLTSDIVALKEEVSQLQKKITRMAETQTVQMKPKQQASPAAASTQSSGSNVRKESPKPAPKVEQKRTFYGMMEDDGTLYEVGDSYSSRTPFVATVQGDTGTVSFNNLALAYLLPRLDTDVLPYFDYELKSSAPTSISPRNSVKIKRKGKDSWATEGKISITIS